MKNCQAFPSGNLMGSNRVISTCRAWTWCVRAIPAVVCLPAWGQPAVSLYGVADLGITVSRNGAPGNPTTTSITSGVMNASRWGLQGSESLGGDLKAVFLLEQGVELDTGAAKAFNGNYSGATPSAPNGPSGTGFSRRSIAGLEGRFGSLTLGRDYAPVYWADAIGDLLKRGFWGNLQQTASPGGGVERFRRVSNGIFYVTPEITGIKGRATYSSGSESGGGLSGSLPKGANEFIGVSVEYTQAGFATAASYQRLKLPLTAGSPAVFTGAMQNRDDWVINARYSFGRLTVSAGYWKMGSPNNVSDEWIGGAVKTGSAGTLITQVQRFRQDNPAGEERVGVVVGISYVHTLSNRTALYASYGEVRNNATASFPLVSSDPILTAGGNGADPRALTFGVRHQF